MISAIPPPLIPIALFYLMCAIISLIGNMIMIICFLRERKFNSPCHYMITLTCAADMLHLCGHFVFNFQLFYDGPGSQELCFWLLLPSCIGLAISGPLLLSMGIDRFLACQFPMVYRQLCSRSLMYLILQLFFPIIYTVYLNVSSFVQRDPKTMVICQVPLAMSGDSFEKFNQGGLIINIGVVIVYFVTFLKLKRLAGSATQLKVVFRSILYTVIFVILGWSTVTMMNIASIHLVEDIDTVHILMIYAGIGLNMACASNIFVFYTIK
ncbi:Protein CBR-SRSX-33 [Caenorhabditis briggsae]|nr:Protein CBR-SRSX-33 [Caenorhabditis briggsae]CAP39831.2 Protein CBR-SRSX-33 [Caenorhabditis briggsae]